MLHFNAFSNSSPALSLRFEVDLGSASALKAHEWSEIKPIYSPDFRTSVPDVRRCDVWISAGRPQIHASSNDVWTFRSLCQRLAHSYPPA